MSSKLSTVFAGISMKSPVMSASGTFGFGLEYSDFVPLQALGAVVVKGTTLAPRAGNTGHRIAETPSGMLNSVGLENPGVDEVIKHILPQLVPYETPVIVNISASTVEEYGLLANKLSRAPIAALEINISCPNVKQGGMVFGVEEESAAAVVASVKQNTDKPIITKLSPNVTDIASMARAVEQAGTDAISLINTLQGMVIDIHSWRPVLGNVMGGLSGPAVKPVAVRMVYQVAQAVSVPIIGMGGITTADDAVEFFLAGASAVAVGTANFANPRAILDITQGLEDYLSMKGLDHVSQLVGQVKL
ncbi:dihydroorotate dehydrogenase (NAD+) catalytic subunit [Sporomusaceae bacterium BoRhaA]|uniref:dihydroorotate dehydrogenase n=1 Tax=Pelorhabdus rhamnosifermentans TaxID=2772457 RepID=UPI001C0639F5|nr:dihydroorotate dehydrogenase [Pelorhabdus rhamnosifermentans]MBU2702453.1 dihydroorotate dehydrogenase (NAD+) catalytic subunit [Pelorhabdus rhamnosifermentans]